MFYLPLLLAVLSTTAYQIAQKSIPLRVNPLVSVSVTYLVALLVSLALLPVVPSRTGVSESLRNLNWATYALGIVVVGIELAFLLVYRVGWKISLASVTSNVTTAMLLLAVGTLWYREAVSARNLLGVAFCLAGLALVAR